MCFLVILGLLMGWVESAAHPSVRDIPEPVEQDMDGEPCASIPDSGGADPLKSVSEKQASAPPHAHHAPLPGIPEFYLLPQRIPVKEPDDTPQLADKYVRSKL